MLKYLLTILLGCVLTLNAVASTVDVYEFSNDAERHRYHKFLEELRCPKCKSNNLAGTNSKIAVDLRRQLQAMINEGKTDAEIVDYMVMRYGDFVLYKPRVQRNTLALWVGPLVFLALGAGIIGAIVRRRSKLKAEAPQLTESETESLRRLLQDRDNTQQQK